MLRLYGVAPWVGTQQHDVIPYCPRFYTHNNLCFKRVTGCVHRSFQYMLTQYSRRPLLSQTSFFRSHFASVFVVRKEGRRRAMNTESVTKHFSGTEQAWHGEIKPDGPFLPEDGRYHMYIGQNTVDVRVAVCANNTVCTGLFCPFAHRANLARHIKGLTDMIDLSIVRPYPKGDDKGWPGWKFPEDNNEYPNATVDKLFGSEYLHDVYFKADKEYKGRYSVPVLWDKKSNTLVNNVRAWASARKAVIEKACIEY